MSDRGNVVIGAGPAGLTAAWQLARMGEPALVLEADPEYVGGLARTIRFRGHRFDIGPHRFYTKSREIERMWRAMLPDGFVSVDRLTRIYYQGKFYAYPIRLRETLRNLGLRRALRVGTSYARACVRPRRPVVSFEDWIVNGFGDELYRTFFKTYTEKVWGVPCAEIDKDWAAQRIRGLSLVAAVRTALFGNRRSRVKSLVERFLYPRGGAGALWESVLDDVLSVGGTCELGADVVGLRSEGRRVVAATTADGRSFEGAHFHVSMTLRGMLCALDPSPPPEILAAGDALRHRDFLVVMLLIDAADLFPDQWIYVHDSDVRVARITNFENWGEDGSALPTRLAAEYFCDRSDPLWHRDDADIVALATEELRAIGLLPAGVRVDGCAIRVTDAYPVYDRGYADSREIVKTWLNASFANLYPAGRRGLHNYNSQDHAMMSAALSVRSQIEGADIDVWRVNSEQEYAEENGAGERVEPRLTPRRIGEAG